MNTLLSLPTYTDENLARLGLEELLDLLTGGEDRVPRNVIDECARRGEEMAQTLSALLEDEHYWRDEIPLGEWWRRLHAVMILGLIPSERAGLLLVKFMRHMSLADDHNLQDWLAGYWPALFRNKPESVLPALRALAEDRGLDWYIRANALDPIVSAAQRQDAEALDTTLAWLAGMAADEQEDWELRLSVGNTLLDFPRAQHRPLLAELATRQTWFSAHFSIEDVQQAYAAMKDGPSWERFKDPWAFYTPAAIEHRQQRWEEENAEPDEDEWEGEDAFMDEVALPYIRPTPKVGRNDPCPCGSGRKYKKCCLPADET